MKNYCIFEVYNDHGGFVEAFAANFVSRGAKHSFSMIEIWNQLIGKNKLYGFESLNDFIHVTDIEIFNKLSKNY